MISALFFLLAVVLALIVLLAWGYTCKRYTAKYIFKKVK